MAKLEIPLVGVGFIPLIVQSSRLSMEAPGCKMQAQRPSLITNLAHKYDQEQLIDCSGPLQLYWLKDTSSKARKLEAI